MTRAIQIAYSSEWSLKVHYDGSHPSEKLKLSQAIYVAWFQKHPNAVLLAFICYENEQGQKAYQIKEVDPVSVVWGYAIPLVLFSVALFLARGKKTTAAAREG